MSLKQNTITLAAAIDNNYAIYLAVALYSALYNLQNKRDVQVFIIDGGISNKNKHRIRRVLNINSIDVNINYVELDKPRLDGLSTGDNDWINISTYLRLYIPHIISSDTDRIIYLDADTLVHTSLSQLYNIPFDSNGVLAAPNIGWEFNFNTSDHIEPNDYDYIDSQDIIFNAGVLVINTDYWIKNHVCEKVLSHVRSHKSKHYHDQDGLNIILSGSWKALDPKWNVQAALLSLDQWPDSPHKQKMARIREELLTDPHITHFSTNRKPTDVDCAHPVQPLWLKYLWHSEWFTPAERLRWFGQWYLNYYWWLLRKTTRPTRHKLYNKFNIFNEHI